MSACLFVCLFVCCNLTPVNLRSHKNSDSLRSHKNSDSHWTYGLCACLFACLLAVALGVVGKDLHCYTFDPKAVDLYISVVSVPRLWT